MLDHLMRDTIKKMTMENQFHSLIELSDIDLSLRQVLYTRFVKVYAKPQRIFQHLNDSLSFTDILFEILRFDRLSFYDLSNCQDQKFIIYSLVFDYLRVVCASNSAIKETLFNYLKDFLWTIQDNKCEPFAKFMYFLEEFVTNNKQFLLERQLVQKFATTLLEWICSRETIYSTHAIFMMGILSKLVMLDKKPIVENQKIVLTALFEKRHSEVFNQFRRPRLITLLKNIQYEEDRIDIDLKTLEESPKKFVVYDSKARFLARYFETLVSCFEQGNLLLQKFCQNIYPLDLIKEAFNNIGKDLVLRNTLLRFIDELYLQTREIDKITANHIIEVFFDDVRSALTSEFVCPT